eukprot:5554872-Alexandrium_andersonii.AAC.1
MALLCSRHRGLLPPSDRGEKRSASPQLGKQQGPPAKIPPPPPPPQNQPTLAGLPRPEAQLRSATGGAPTA